MPFVVQIWWNIYQWLQISLLLASNLSVGWFRSAMSYSYQAQTQDYSNYQRCLQLDHFQSRKTLKCNCRFDIAPSTCHLERTIWLHYLLIQYACLLLGSSSHFQISKVSSSSYRRFENRKCLEDLLVLGNFCKSPQICGRRTFAQATLVEHYWREKLGSLY
jgi:hypothetical protein